MFKNLKFNKNYIYLFFLLSFLCFFLIDFQEEGDIYFLLSHGRYIFNNGIPHTEILSMHSEFNFIMQQWLSSAIFYFIYNYLGKSCFYIFMFIINFIITYLIYKLCLVISNNKKFSSCFISVIAIILLQIGFIVFRPQIFTFIILLMILIMLELFSSKRKKYLYFMPVLSILLINLHASMWPMIFILCMPYVVELVIKKDKDVLLLLLFMTISILVGIINPYGVGAKTYGYKYICDVISEMKSVNLLGDAYVFYWSVNTLIIFLVSNLIILLNSKKENIRVSHILLFYGTFIMALLSIRNVAIFILCTVPFLVKYFEFRDDNNFYLNKKWIINYIIIIMIVICAFSNAIKNKIISYLNKNASKNIKIFTNVSIGPMLEYFGYKPYIDTRAEVFMKKLNGKENILEEYVKFNLRKDVREEFINKYDFDYYIIEKSNYDLINYLINYKNKNYELVLIYEDNYLIKKVS